MSFSFYETNYCTKCGNEVQEDILVPVIMPYKQPVRPKGTYQMYEDNMLCRKCFKRELEKK